MRSDLQDVIEASKSLHEVGSREKSFGGRILGMQIAISGNRMTISHTEKNIHSWRADGALTMSSTNRDVAQVIGRIIWDACLRMTPFGSISDIIGQLRKVSAAEEDDTAWWERENAGC